MTRRLEGRAAIEVYPTERGQVAIKQDGDAYSGEDDMILLDVNDIPTIVQWLQEAAVDAAEIRQMNLAEADEEPIKVGE